MLMLQRWLSFDLIKQQHLQHLELKLMGKLIIIRLMGKLIIIGLMGKLIIIVLMG